LRAIELESVAERAGKKWGLIKWSKTESLVTKKNRALKDFRRKRSSE